MLKKLHRWGIPIAILGLKGGEASSCSESTTFLRYGESEQIRVREPPFVDSASTTGNFEIPKPYVAVYNQSRLVGKEDPMGLTFDGKPIEDVARRLRFDVLRQIRNAGVNYGWLPTTTELFSRNSGLEAKDRFDCIVPFTRRKPHINYYHWITEQLPRVRGIEAYIKETGNIPDVLIESDPPSWIEESLDLVGIPRERRVEWTYDKATVDQLVVPKYVRKADPGTYEPSKADLEWVRERLLSSVDRGQNTSSRRLFVSRSDATTRRLANRSEVIEVLQEFDFEVVVPSEHTVKEQIRMFRDAEIVVGPHGAGLTNILFSDDATVVELFPSDYTPGYFFVIAELFDIEYRCIIGDDADPDFHVDAHSVRSTVQKLTR